MRPDLTWKWIPVKGSLTELITEAQGLGPVIMKECSSGQLATIELGVWTDLYVRCEGKGQTLIEALGQALARARFAAGRLVDPIALSPVDLRKLDDYLDEFYEHGAGQKATHSNQKETLP